MLKGWSWVLDSPKWHYFRSRERSVCGRFLPSSDSPLYASVPITGIKAGMVQHSKTCTKCQKAHDADTKETSDND